MRPMCSEFELVDDRQPLLARLTCRPMPNTETAATLRYASNAPTGSLSEPPLPLH